MRSRVSCCFLCFYKTRTDVSYSPPTYTFRYKGVSHNDVKGYEGRLLDTKLRNLNPGVEIQSITYRLGMLLLNVVGWNSHNIVLEKGVVLLAPDAEGGKHLAVE